MTPADVISLSAMLSANLSYPRGSCRFVGREDPIIINTTSRDAVGARDGGWTAR